ncbi:hypothetical protein FQ142_11840 [Microbacterium sp. ANT_H45B]|uniref:restriction endonuclease subunit S n=1 Tax=Microbacterium sp. ANT_H45B TaxID=2597346 RepID=UPI0011EF3D34|nr:restriction endonuclease subunit S [Microbacterium sp. ANT_H45B]KAA0961497.1 hypothetical protein FQ142_11840 [Microbacterium sp. ANT_H45B]
MTKLPTGWIEKPLAKIVRLGSGGTPQAKNPAYYGGDIPWAIIGDLCDGPVSVTQNTITQLGLDRSSAKVVPADTILLGMYGSIGKLGIASMPMATNQAIATMQVGDELEFRYLFYYLLSQRSRLDREGKGATQRNISQTILRPWPVRFPVDLVEQQRIIGILEDHFSRLDAADAYIDSARRRAENLDSQLLVTQLAVLGTQEVRFGELLSTGLSNGKSVPTQDGGFPVLRLTALRDGRIDLTERKDGAWTAADAARFMVRRGDFLIARGNGSRRLVGRGGLVRDAPDAVAFPDTLIRARPDLGRIDPEFLALVWNAPMIRRQIEAAAKTTAGIYKVNQKDLAEIRVPLPSLADQTRVARAVQESRDALSRLAVEVDRVNYRSLALRRSVLIAAFSGRLTSQSIYARDIGDLISV